jgi:hypothetical protein
VMQLYAGIQVAESIQMGSSNVIWSFGVWLVAAAAQGVLYGEHLSMGYVPHAHGDRLKLSQCLCQECLKSFHCSKLHMKWGWRDTHANRMYLHMIENEHNLTTRITLYREQMPITLYWEQMPMIFSD